MTTDAPWTVKRLLEWTTDYLGQHGADTPRLDAEILLGHALNWPRIQLYVRFEECPSEQDRARFREAIKLRAKGTPVAYLTGEKEFFSLKFQVNESVLIPRPETEFLVVGALDAIRGSARPTTRVLDLCTGSGCIAVAIAKHVPQCQIVATDSSAAAIEVARLNAQSHSVSERIEFRCGDLWEAVPEDSFDIIVSNPPYIGLSEKDSLMRDVVAHEPHQALFSGDDGTDLTRRIIAQAAAKLAPEGWLLIETSPLIAQRLLDEMNRTPGLDRVHSKKDLAGHLRVLIARRAAN